MGGEKSFAKPNFLVVARFISKAKLLKTISNFKSRHRYLTLNALPEILLIVNNFNRYTHKS